MPLRLKKYPEEAPLQGYADDKTYLADVQKLTEAYQANKTAVSGLVIGQACANLKAVALQKLEKAKAKLLEVLPTSSASMDVKVEMAALKEIPRIMQKAVHAANCDK